MTDTPEKPPATTAQMQRRKVALIALTMLAVAFVAVLAGKGVFRPKADARPAVAEMKARIKLPALVDGVTRLEDIRAEEDKVIYVMTLMKPREEALDRTAKMNYFVREAACAGGEYNALLKKDLTIVIAYSDLDAKPLQTITVTPQDCAAGKAP